MSFDDDETGVETSIPRDLYTFELPAVTYRLTSSVRDIVYGGQTYRAAVTARESVAVPSFNDEGALQIPIDVRHALPQRYLRGGIPPLSIAVTVRRLQSTSGEAQIIWAGNVTSMAIDGHVAKFLVPSGMAEAISRRLPTITAGKECPHVLYDGGCQVVQASFTVTRTVIGVDGQTVTLDSAPDADDTWSVFGVLVHPTSGEQRTITSQTGAVIVMQLPIPDLQYGDTVQISAGCSHLVQTCHVKFNNVANYGGLPQLPSGNPFIPGSRGIFSLKKFLEG